MRAGVDDQYFPDTLAQFKRQWFGKHLTAMREPSLLHPIKNADSDFSFRFLWLRSFHNPTSIRLEHSKLGTILYAKSTLESKSGHETLERDDKIILTDAQFNEFMSIFNSSKFFDVPWEQDLDDGDDGAQWIFEVNDGKKYRLVDSVGGGTAREIGVCLLKDAHLLPQERRELY